MEFVYRCVRGQNKFDVAVVDVDDIHFHQSAGANAEATVQAPWGRSSDRLGGAVCSFSLTRNGQLQVAETNDSGGNPSIEAFAVYRSPSAAWRAGSGSLWQIADDAYDLDAASEERRECLLVPVRPALPALSADCYALVDNSVVLDAATESCVVRAQPKALADRLCVWEAVGFVQKNLDPALEALDTLRESRIDVLRTLSRSLAFSLSEGSASTVLRICELLESPALHALAAMNDDAAVRERVKSLSPMHQILLVQSLLSVRWRDCSADDLGDVETALSVLNS